MWRIVVSKLILDSSESNIPAIVAIQHKLNDIFNTSLDSTRLSSNIRLNILKNYFLSQLQDQQSAQWNRYACPNEI